MSEPMVAADQNVILIWIVAAKMSVILGAALQNVRKE